MNEIKTYTKLSEIKSYEERFKYLSLNSVVGKETFGFDRYLNQELYKSKQWRDVRDEVILRDGGMDMGVEGYDIPGTIVVHHMNPINSDDIIESSDFLLNPEYLISVSLDTHNAIHYGNKDYVKKNQMTIRRPNDHCPWKK
jgi:hypothetical protein